MTRDQILNEAVRVLICANSHGERYKTISAATLFTLAITSVAYSYARRTQRHNKDERRSSFRKIYLPLYLKGLWVRGSWRPNRTATYRPPLLWPSAFLSRSPELLNRGPGAQPLWVLVFSTASYLQLVWSPNWLNFLCTQSLPITGHGNIHFCRLWNGMFDRQRAEITVMQFTGHSLPGHQFVTVPWDFNPVPYCQPISPTPMEYATSAVFGIACLAGSEVNILKTAAQSTKAKKFNDCISFER